MNSPAVISFVKKVFHILSLVASAQAFLQTGVLSKFVPEKYAILLAMVFSFVSGILHLLTTYFPDVAAAESGK